MSVHFPHRADDREEDRAAHQEDASPGLTEPGLDGLTKVEVTAALKKEEFPRAEVWRVLKAIGQ
jgi:hypothetical protein